MDKWDDELPFDELDPCCQREIVNERKNSSIRSELRKHDRSNIRQDMKLRAFDDVFKKSHCLCCTSSGDYSLLSIIRHSGLYSSNESAKLQANPCVADPDDGSDDGSDIDFDFITPYEQERLAEMKKKASQAGLLLKLGYGVHICDSIEHIKAHIAANEKVVIHLCNENSRLSARIDLVLEKLAAQNLGTIFRRVAFSGNIAALIEKWGVSGLAANSHSHILCFSFGRQTAVSSDLSQFGSDTHVFEQELESFLQKSSSLCPFPSESMLEGLEQQEDSSTRKFSADVAVADEEIDEENELAYCDDPTCLRRFPHEHVARAGGSLTGAADSSGAEALAPNIFYKM